MNEKTRLERLLEALKRLHSIKAPITPSTQWERRLMRDIRAMQLSSEPAEEPSVAPFYLRFSFAAILLAILVHVSYRFSSIEETIALNSVTQLDPLGYAEDIDEE